MPSRSGEGGGLMHGPTFMANPLACSVALASLELLTGEHYGDAGGWRGRVRAIERGLQDGLAPARELPGVADVRVLGAIGVVQLEREVDMAAATSAAVAQGVWLRPFRDLDLHDAAVRDERAGSRADRGGRRRGGARRSELSAAPSRRCSGGCR